MTKTNLKIDIVAHFKDNRILKGKTSDFFPNKPDFNLETIEGKTVNIPLEELKAVFFVKDYKGDRQRKDNYNETIPGAGLKIRVKFSDGETLIGYSLNHFLARHGFFMRPADSKSNNERIFVITSAVETIEFL
jgi:hypothetical protein